MLLIEQASARVRGVIFQERELRTLPASPVLGRSQQFSANALILMPAPYRDLRNVAVGYFPVHGIQRLIEPGIQEPNNLTPKLRDKSDVRTAVRRMLPPLSVACRYCFNRRDHIELRIKAGMMLRAFEEGAGDSVSVFRNSPANNRHRV